MRSVHELVVGCAEKFFASDDPKLWIRESPTRGHAGAPLVTIEEVSQ
jgi:hypothetical protein